MHCRGGGTEVIARYTSSINSRAEFYTDSNGRQMMYRVRNYYPTFNFTNIEPVSGGIGYVL